MGIKIKSSGLFIDEYLPFLAATPDGLIDDDGTVEIKCPSSCSDLTPVESILKRKITFWTIDKKNNEIKGINPKHLYYFQIQGQLHISKRKYCLFVVWTPHEIKLERIDIDDEF
ncbi:hypothetical protein AVEN_220265-1 [Araneus ventricosus]|uniref:YqaJ viral recombinase domain-containing protein n=1 Tax=Araneus ventricosus TaxID=182803 RepID=A0A4Y2KFS4_ARAVE|nr:hypothetical protein AVEN_220265-1 [Araneus ventricosus]